MIRAFERDDAEAVSALHADTIRRVNASDYPAEQIEAWASRSSPQRFIDSMADHVRFVYDEGALLGFADYTPHTSQFTGLYVSADHQREGIGRALCEGIEADARERGFRRLWLESTLTAAPFYESMGFSKRSDDTYRVGDHEIRIVVMEKDLGAA